MRERRWCVRQCNHNSRSADSYVHRSTTYRSFHTCTYSTYLYVHVLCTILDTVAEEYASKPFPCPSPSHLPSVAGMVKGCPAEVVNGIQVSSIDTRTHTHTHTHTHTQRDKSARPSSIKPQDHHQSSRHTQAISVCKVCQKHII